MKISAAAGNAQSLADANHIGEALPLSSRRQRRRYSRLADKHNKRARKAGAPGRLKGLELQSLFAAHRKTCPLCGERAKLTLDHINPLSRGGPNLISNVQPICGECHRRKDDAPKQVNPLQEIFLKRIKPAYLIRCAGFIVANR